MDAVIDSFIQENQPDMTNRIAAIRQFFSGIPRWLRGKQPIAQSQQAAKRYTPEDFKPHPRNFSQAVTTIQHSHSPYPSDALSRAEEKPFAVNNGVHPSPKQISVNQMIKRIEKVLPAADVDIKSSPKTETHIHIDGRGLDDQDMALIRAIIEKRVAELYRQGTVKVFPVQESVHLSSSFNWHKPIVVPKPLHLTTRIAEFMSNFDRNGVPLKRIQNAFSEFSKASVSGRVSEMVKDGRLIATGRFRDPKQGNKLVTFYVGKGK